MQASDEKIRSEGQIETHNMNNSNTEKVKGSLHCIVKDPLFHCLLNWEQLQKPSIFTNSYAQNFCETQPNGFKTDYTNLASPNSLVWKSQVAASLLGEDFTLKIEPTSSTETLVSYCISSWCHNTDHQDVNLNHLFNQIPLIYFIQALHLI